MGSSAAPRSGALIAAKLNPPDLPTGIIQRQRIAARVAAAPRVALIVAPPGYGKTVVARQLTDAIEMPWAWLSLDLLDQNPATFWLHLARAVRSVLPDVDGEVEQALAADVRGTFFLAVLIAQIEQSSGSATLVLDDVGHLTDPRILDGIALLVDRVGERLRLVLTARSDPMLPIARWRASGWLVDVREAELRLTEVEALAVAASFESLSMSEPTIMAVNRHVDGWPIAFHLALVSAGEAEDHEERARALTRSDDMLADYLVAELLDQLPDEHREIALALSIVDWFDGDICRELAGPGAIDVVTALESRRLLLMSIADHPGTRRFHPLFRTLLETELRWRDPMRHAELHRRAASMWEARGDLNAAYRHLRAAGAVADSHELVIEPAIRMADRGDRMGLALLADSLPHPSEVDEPALALDVAMVWIFTGSGVDATMWCDRAEHLLGAQIGELWPRIHTTRCVIALMDGDLARARRHAAEFEKGEPRTTALGPIDRRFATVAARIALADRDLESARRWLDRANSFSEPAFVASVIVPALGAWLELLSGRLRRAIELIEPACAWAEQAEMRPHFGASDALATAAWCELGGGDLTGAGELAAVARADAELLRFDWPRIRAGAVAAHVRLLTDGPAAAMALVRDVRGGLDHGVRTEFARQLDVVEARALTVLGRLDEARLLVQRAGEAPPFQLARAAIAAAAGDRAQLVDLLADTAAWPIHERLESQVLLASAGALPGADGALRAALVEGASSGWVSPFLGHGADVDEMLRRQPLEDVHPQLARHLRPAATGRGDIPLEPLTPRELTILALLPSHLSYAEIGAELYVSVNTVKSNLKSVYRKLAVTSRSAAVDASRAAGLI